jgi:O-antigen ligase
VATVSAFEWMVLVLVLLFVLRAVWVPPDPRPGPDEGLRDGGRRGWRLFGHPVARTGFGAPVALFVALVIAQLVPLPPSILRLLSPVAAGIDASSLPGWGSPSGVEFARIGNTLLGAGHDDVVGRILGGEGSLPIEGTVSSGNLRPLSLYPFATFNRLLILLTLLGLFAVSVNVFRKRDRIGSALRWIVLFGFALSVFAIVQRLSWNGRIFWVFPVDPEASPFGPFVNHNHFAAFIAMLVPVATGMLMDEARRLSASATGRAGRGRAARGRSSTFAIHGPEPFARLLLAAFVVAVMAGALVLSASRGAVIALGAAFVLYGGALLVQGRVSRPEALVAVVLLVTAMALSSWLGVGPLAQKLKAIGEGDTEPSLMSRALGWKWTVAIVGDFPLLGTGLGTFAESWKHYYPPGTSAVWHEAHNDYLQLLSETGAVGFVIFLAALGIFAWRFMLPGILTSRRSEPYTVHGIVVGLVAVAFHSIVDFPLQINACAVLFVVLSSALVAWRLAPEDRA